jgi:hypothetical protein
VTTFLIGLIVGTSLTRLLTAPPRRRRPRDLYGPLHKWGHPMNRQGPP